MGKCIMGAVGAGAAAILFSLISGGGILPALIGFGICMLCAVLAESLMKDRSTGSSISYRPIQSTQSRSDNPSISTNLPQSPREVELAEVNALLQEAINLNHVPQQRVLLQRKKGILEDIFIGISALQEPTRADNLRRELEQIDSDLRKLQR